MFYPPDDDPDLKAQFVIVVTALITTAVIISIYMAALIYG